MNHLFKQLEFNSNFVAQLVLVRIVTPAYDCGVGNLSEFSDSGKASG